MYENIVLEILQEQKWVYNSHINSRVCSIALSIYCDSILDFPKSHRYKAMSEQEICLQNSVKLNRPCS
ncbi:uncharacterized protein Gasu_51090 [Galdieria sulphuraria]|uniref:Uncharacterized protein n=1 Tax=Galdieria sulphuraria TaxID=130081 RepID=M2XUS8_GALSU|nr:uncharacterized protein Gasu_51090 [Galdieria sulphuraria]EME27383.1 hypothetical protein Gasu_51090 [Galdieria sulphuraria]|eukprot:XP_005703903.1 hypothetical protein Gasu_51090 [Galdieria sulphuraria]